MTKLVDADQLLKTIPSEEIASRIAVANAPPVEAEPVRHGKWIEVDVGDCCYRCSECGFIRDAYLLDVSNYCPKCGAKMDGGEEK